MKGATIALVCLGLTSLWSDAGAGQAAAPATQPPATATAADQVTGGRTAYELIKRAGRIGEEDGQAIEAAGELNPGIFDAAAGAALSNHSVQEVKSSPDLAKGYVADLLARSRLQAVASNVVLVSSAVQAKLQGAIGRINTSVPPSFDLPTSLSREIDMALAAHHYVIKPVCPQGIAALLAAAGKCVQEAGWSRDLFRSVVPVFVDGKQICSGTAIGQHLILTAAHCVIADAGTHRSVIDYAKVSVGGRAGGQIRLSGPPKVPQEMLAGNCLPDCFDPRYDFALLQTDAAADGGWSPLSVVTKISVPGDTPITIAGYGISTLTTKESPDGLFIGKQQLHLAATADDFRWGYKFALDPLGSSCGGDSGGPVFLGSPRKDGDALRLVGVISSLSVNSCLNTTAVAVNLTTPGPAKAFCALLPSGSTSCS